VISYSIVTVSLYCTISKILSDIFENLKRLSDPEYGHFRRPLQVTVALCYGTVVCLSVSLSVTLVY